MPRSARPLLLFVPWLWNLAAIPAQEPLPAPIPPSPPNQAVATAVEGAPSGNAAAPSADDTPADDKPKQKRRGIPVADTLVHTHCARCHALDDQQHMTRVSFVRKSPEGWAETLKRMGRLHGLQLSPSDAKQLVRSLANSHGLTRNEAERGLYESERRVHWSEEHHDQDFRRACAQCHPLGRVLLQQRDDEEWQLLRATHVAMFPLARGQMGGGAPDPDERRGGGGRGGAGGTTSGPPGAAAAEPARGRQRAGEAAASEGPGGGPTPGVGDRVLQKLAKDQPLFTPEWETWSMNRREVPLAGVWSVSGHETGRGDLRGTATLRRADADEYEVAWDLTFAGGGRVERTGKGLLYAGYSWRGRSKDGDGAEWKEVLLLDAEWRSLRGRFFSGAYDEIGVDVTLHRELGRPRVLALGNAAIAVPTTGHRVEVYGEALPATIAPANFFVGSGLVVQGLERHSDRHLTLLVDAAAGSELGPRLLALGSEPGETQMQLYDTVDYVRIRPLQGLARVGGAKNPKQTERFEAFAVHRGKDEKPFTDDDVDLFQVWPRWGLAEFRSRENDDDVQYVGSIDPSTGVFTPNVDGPNPARKWQANNVGDVFVTAEIELDVAVRPPKPKEEAKTEPPKANGPGAEPAGAAPPPVVPVPPEAGPPVPVPPPAVPTAAPSRERKLFLARAHLVVTVPLYVRWMSLDWEDR